MAAGLCRKAGSGRVVPPRGWYSKHRRNVDQLTEPGGAGMLEVPGCWSCGSLVGATGTVAAALLLLG